MPYPKVCIGCWYRAEEGGSDNLVCESMVVAGPDKDGNCEEWWEGDEDILADAQRRSQADSSICPSCGHIDGYHPPG